MTIELRLCLVICAAFLLLLSFEKSETVSSPHDFLILARSKLCLGASCHFPGDCLFFSAVLGIQSPSNFVFLAVIALLLIREFSLPPKISKLEKKLVSLVQETALNFKK